MTLVKVKVTHSNSTWVKVWKYLISNVRAIFPPKEVKYEVAKKGNAQVKHKYLKAILKHSTQVNVLNSLTKEKRKTMSTMDMNRKTKKLIVTVR